MEVIYSKIDNTSKHTANGVEFNFINKNDGKDILCVPSQTSCNLGCTFCHLTGDGVKTQKIDRDWFYSRINEILCERDRNHSEILFSFMGAGEPLLDPHETIVRMHALPSLAKRHGYTRSRFAVATIIPSTHNLREFTNSVRRSGLNVKLHLSIHNPFDLERKQLMPGAVKLEDSLGLLRRYHSKTGNAIEIHYTPIYNKNNSIRHAEELAALADTIPVKLLKMSSKDGMTGDTSEFGSNLRIFGTTVEEYDPPGRDIGSSCGQFHTSN